MEVRPEGPWKRRDGGQGQRPLWRHAPEHSALRPGACPPLPSGTMWSPRAAQAQGHAWWKSGEKPSPPSQARGCSSANQQTSGQLREVAGVEKGGRAPQRHKQHPFHAAPRQKSTRSVGRLRKAAPSPGRRSGRGMRNSQEMLRSEEQPRWTEWPRAQGEMPQSCPVLCCPVPDAVLVPVHKGERPAAPAALQALCTRLGLGPLRAAPEGCEASSVGPWTTSVSVSPRSMPIYVIVHDVYTV